MLGLLYSDETILINAYVHAIYDIIIIYLISFLSISVTSVSGTIP